MAVRKRVLSAGVLGSALVVMAITVGGAATKPAATPFPGRVHPPIRIREAREGSVSAYNWSGYAVTGAVGSVSDAKGSWVVPTVSCNAGTANQYSSFWVGIDGFSSNSVEQIGVDADCRSGSPTYYAWFEFYPHPMFTINTLTVAPGDVISAEAKYNGNGMFTVSITNLTRGGTFSTTAKVQGAQRSSAEWIAEAPSSSGGILPLADFGTVYFGQDTTSVSPTCDATVNGTTGTIGGFGPAVQQITMVSSSGAVKAQPSSLSSDGSSFSDTWYSAGP